MLCALFVRCGNGYPYFVLLGALLLFGTAHPGGSHLLGICNTFIFTLFRPLMSYVK